MKGGGKGRLKREQGLNNFLPLKGGDLFGRGWGVYRGFNYGIDIYIYMRHNR